MKILFVKFIVRNKIRPDDVKHPYPLRKKKIIITLSAVAGTKVAANESITNLNATIT